MCWDEKTSWTTLLIGTAFNLFNIFYFREPIIIVISLLWQWVLMMQLFEALAWRDYKSSQGCKNSLPAQGALIANLTQPIILALSLIIITPVSLTNKVLAGMAVFGYICWVLYGLNQTENFTCLKPADGCDHLDLVWWKKLPGGAVPYLITLFAVIYLLMRPVDLAAFEAAYIFGTLIISSIFYSCGTGSMWCWFAAFAPVATGMYWYYTRGAPVVS